MYKKELKERFKDMIIRQAKLAAAFGDVDNFKWICLYYFDGLNDAMYASNQYDSYLKPFTSEKFEYIFKSIVEYRKRVC